MCCTGEREIRTQGQAYNYSRVHTTWQTPSGACLQLFSRTKVPERHTVAQSVRLSHLLLCITCFRLYLSCSTLVYQVLMFTLLHCLSVSLICSCVSHASGCTCPAQSSRIKCLSLHFCTVCPSLSFALVYHVLQVLPILLSPRVSSA